MLAAEDFMEFYYQVNGERPFPWQADLVREVLSERAWPELIDVPTGMGKTALLDVAVFVAAATSTEVGFDRLGRRRIFLVVDRRIVVDEAYDRAMRLSAALDREWTSGQDTVVRQVALGLHALAPRADQPLSVPAPITVRRTPRAMLQVTRMRGGVTWDAAWLDRPDIPGIVIGTIDQVGSRMLFRGYGVSDRRKSVDAALVGTDSLILVDEAHLAEVMVSTISEAYRRDHGSIGLPRAEVVRMTATAGDATMRRYSIDVDAHRGDEVAWRRLNASKRLSLVLSDKKSVVQDLADQAVALLTQDHDTILVVCNTVDRARQVQARLDKATTQRQGPLQAEITLLIGRSRPADRDLLVSRLKKRFGVERRRIVGEVPAILVATQTVEVGANLDVDGLVSESAPWDSLVQRLGRLNRLGDCPGTSLAVVVHDGVEEGPIYGKARQVTWNFLSINAEESGEGLDVSPLACRDLGCRLPSGAFAPRPNAPLLTLPTLDCWVRTAPLPLPDTPVSPYLHGLGHDLAIVSIAWRDGLIDPDPTGEDVERTAEDINVDLSAVPVRPEELVEVPLHAVRRWLAGEATLPLSDLDQDVDLDQRVKKTRGEFRGLVWRSDPILEMNDGRRSASHSNGSWRWVDAGAVRPGDVIVVPAERGGIDQYGWEPESNRRVLDVSEVIRSIPLRSDGFERSNSTPLLRLDENIGGRLGLTPENSLELRRLLRDLGNDSEDRQRESAERELLDFLAAAIERVLESNRDVSSDERLPGTAWTPTALLGLRSWVVGPVTVVPLFDRQGEGSRRFILAPSANAGWPVERDDEFPECSSMGLGQVTLRIHHANVGDRARDIARALGLSRELARAVEAAARWHDLGKIDSRFQVMLCGGDEYAALLIDEPLAKSGIDPADRAAYRRSRVRSGLPGGARHEAWSAALVREYLDEVAESFACDPDLVIHLVASHHGHARPWLPAVHDDKPRDLSVLLEGTGGAPEANVIANTVATVDFDHPARFARLNRVYGRWGLALLESIVRCADITVSGEGS